MRKHVRVVLGATVLLLAIVAEVRAQEVAAPAGTSITFDTNSPTSAKTYFQGSGQYSVPTNWDYHETLLRVFTVVDGKKGTLVTEARMKFEPGTPNLWFGPAKGLTANTEYWVEARLEIRESGKAFPDHAYASASAGVKKTLP